MSTSWDLDLTLRSPLLIGGRRTRTDDTPSVDVISGSVMRAAVARAILAECPYPGTDAHPLAWVAFRDRAACGDCRWRGWCRQFSDITFDHLRPAGGEVLPMTARRCKQHPHGTWDGLTHILSYLETGRGAPEWGCPACGGPTEQVRGVREAVQGSGRASLYEPYHFHRARSVRTRIDPRRQRAADGNLYTVRPILPERRLADGRWEPQRFTGAVHAPAAVEGLEDRAVPVGARTTSGYGDVEARLRGGAPRDRDDAAGRVRELNVGLDAALDGAPRRYVWLTLDLETDALVTEEDLARTAGLEPPARLSALLLPQLSPPPDLELDHGWVDWSPWRGWDTRGPQARRKPAVLRVLAGSVLVLRGPREQERDVLRWVDAVTAGLGPRVGRETGDGFGHARIVHPFHLVAGEAPA